MEIEVGEYVRTKDGKIIKFKKFSKSRYSRYREKDLEDIKTIIDNRGCHYKYDNIVKHSKNIIDLIEAGDYVELEYIPTGEYSINFIENDFGLKMFKDNFKNGNYKIKSILTKEQYNSNCYRLEE